MQRDLWIVIAALFSIALIASICTAALPKASFGHKGLPSSDPSVLLVSESSPYMRNER
ncbi:hypothetical protein M2232_004437 [Bradyrhizobium japonicum]|jgi:hypothetical protein|nr:hypothetical protein [Bradyrhizobium japonicum]MCS3960215.1 hypothetical protein [Bradyrhizobium japonicum]MCS3978692.1 hypothetical protein [Bradyrhizobium japonicum]MCS4001968.1 hypothetical protein [Bradyrhizobium japonicum]MCW2220905.1 hypothetical protein [Bradyrhizobium japonicum]